MKLDYRYCKYSIDDSVAWILRCVKLEDWPAGGIASGRTMVRTSWPNVFRIPAPGGGWLKREGKGVLDDPEPELDAYVQVTE